MIDITSDSQHKSEPTEKDDFFATDINQDLIRLSLGGLVLTPLIAAKLSVVAALAYGIAYLGGMTTVIGTMTCGAMVGATALGAFIVSLPLIASVYFAAKFNFIPSVVNFFILNGAFMLAAITGAAVLGMAITPVAVCASITTAISLAFSSLALASYYLSGDERNNVENTPCNEEPSPQSCPLISPSNAFFPHIEKNTNNQNNEELHHQSNMQNTA